MTLDGETTALIVIDAQQAFGERERAGERRNNPGALAAIAELLRACRAAGVAVIHVRHESGDPGSRFHPSRPGHAVEAQARERPGEIVVHKRVNSAFIGTDLRQRLDDGGLRTLLIVGATTNHCVETTARMAGNLGYDAVLVSDATWTFDRAGPDGRVHAAADIHDMSLANLDGEFARLASTREVLDALAAGVRGGSEGSAGSGRGGTCGGASRDGRCFRRGVARVRGTRRKVSAAFWIAWDVRSRRLSAGDPAFSQRRPSGRSRASPDRPSHRGRDPVSGGAARTEDS